MTFQPGANLCGAIGTPTRPENIEVPHYDVRIPSTGDWNYPIGKEWIFIGNSIWKLLSISASRGVNTANWAMIFSNVATVITGDLTLATVGGKINIATGTNASVGTSGAMIAGSVVVPTTAITANSLVFFTTNVLGTVTAPQAYRVSARTPGVSFTIQSQSVTDTSTVNYWIIN